MQTKYFFRNVSVSFFLLIISITAVTQNAEIDSLKRVLQTVKDTARVKALNQLALAFIDYYSDTSLIIVTQSYNEAKNINYSKGMAEALRAERNIRFLRGELTRHGERIYNMALPIYEKDNNMNGIAGLYWSRGMDLKDQCKFNDAIGFFRKAIKIYKTERNSEMEAYTLTRMGDAHRSLGKYDSAYKIYNESLKAAETIKGNNRSYSINGALSSLAILFREIGDIEMFNSYQQQASKFKSDADEVEELVLSSTHLEFKQYDSALIYWNKWVDKYSDKFSTHDPVRKTRLENVNKMFLGQIFAGLKKYDSAIIYLEHALIYFKEKGPTGYELVGMLPAIARSYYAKSNYPKALTYATEFVAFAEERKIYSALQNGYQLLSDIYEKTGDKDKANFYFRKYSQLKDELKTDEFKQKLQLYKAEEREKQKQSSIEQLKKEKRWLTSGIILLAISIASFFGFIWVQRKYNTKKRLLQANEIALKQAEDERRIASLEMMSLRSQMNPHFIFNCLNSINRFVLRNDTEAASGYLTKFSKLMRMVLENSKQVLIPLEEEVKCLELYIQMEQFRCKNSFTYYIKYHDGVNTEEAMIPPLLLQPFVENAIWHGVNPKEGDGKIGIEFFQKEEALYCVIKDNGIGRKKASELKSQLSEHHKPMGLQITKERLAIMEERNESPVEIEDLYDERGEAAGTKVTIRIFSLPTFEELKSSLNL